MDRYFFFFIPYVFGEPAVHFFIIFSSVAPHRGQPAAKCHPRWQPTKEDWQSAVGWGPGEMPDSNPGLGYIQYIYILTTLFEKRVALGPKLKFILPDTRSNRSHDTFPCKKRRRHAEFIVLWGKNEHDGFPAALRIA
jgi:hypothetical protein